MWKSDRKSKLLCVLLYVALVLNSSRALAYIPPNVTESYLYASYVQQEKSRWCWVACAENATIQEGCNTMDQYNAVYILKGYTPNFYPNVGGTPSETAVAAELMCNHALDYVSDSAKTFSFISDKIYNGHSVIAGYTYTLDGDTFNHMVLLMGWNTSSGVQKIKFYNPQTGNYQTESFALFCSGLYNDSVYVSSVYVD